MTAPSVVEIEREEALLQARKDFYTDTLLPTLGHIKAAPFVIYASPPPVGLLSPLWLQVGQWRDDNAGPPQGHAPARLHKGRKYLLSPHMVEGEIAQTALMACLAFLEHEMRELFLYKGFSIWDGHYDLDALVALRGSPGGGLKGRAPHGD